MRSERKIAYQKKYNKAYYASHRPSMLQEKKQWTLENREVHLWQRCKTRAKKASWEFTITPQDIVIPERCPLLGIILTNRLGEGKLSTNSSVDRKNSSIGYTKDNIWVISCLANNMKSNATREQLVQFARSILAHYEE